MRPQRSCHAAAYSLLALRHSSRPWALRNPQCCCANPPPTKLPRPPARLCRWQASGLLRQLVARKRVFREPRSAGEVEACLADYADCIQAAAARGSSGGGSNGGGGSSGGKAVVTLGSAGKPPSVHAENSSGNQGGGRAGGGGSGSLSGAVMLCVVGGKLAEGINFGDALGRCAALFAMISSCAPSCQPGMAVHT